MRTQVFNGSQDAQGKLLDARFSSLIRCVCVCVYVYVYVYVCVCVCVCVQVLCGAHIDTNTHGTDASTLEHPFSS